MHLPVVVAALLSVAPTAVEPVTVLDAGVPTGFELVDRQAGLTFEEYAELEPDAVDYLDPSDPDADGFAAAVDVFATADDELLVRQVVRWSSPKAAANWVGQAEVIADDEGLAPVDAEVPGGVAFASNVGVAARLVVWQQGAIGVQVEHFGVDDVDPAIADDAATALASTIEAATGSVPAANTAPPVDDEGGGGISTATVVVWILVFGGFYILYRQVRARQRHLITAEHRRPRADDRSDVEP